MSYGKKWKPTITTKWAKIKSEPLSAIQYYFLKFILKKDIEVLDGMMVKDGQ